MAGENRTGNKQVPADQIEKRGVVQDVVLPVLQEAKPIAEGIAIGLGVHKLTQDEKPPTDGNKPK